MNKDKIRGLKFHYLSRWSVLRYNQKHQDKILLFADLFVTKNLRSGNTLFYDCLGEIYQGIVPNASFTPGVAKYDNLVMLNNPEFKYKTTGELAAYVSCMADKFLVAGGRVIMSFEHRGVIYDRVHQTVDSMLADFTNGLVGLQSSQFANLLSKSPPGYGDYFYCLDHYA